MKINSPKEKHMLFHYANVARINGLKGSCSMEDPYVRKTETQFVQHCIKDFQRDHPDKPLRILDCGCGNGYLLHTLEAQLENCELMGLEYSTDMFELAASRPWKSSKIQQGDMRKPEDVSDPIDILITERSLINLPSAHEQANAMKNLFSKLNDGGIWIMIESFEEPLRQLNRARKEMLIPGRSASKHNVYLKESLIRYFNGFGLIEQEGPLSKRHLSTYFYITRILHKLGHPKGLRRRNSILVHFLRDALPPAVGNFSPILLRLFQKNLNEAKYDLNP